METDIPIEIKHNYYHNSENVYSRQFLRQDMEYSDKFGMGTQGVHISFEENSTLSSINIYKKGIGYSMTYWYTKNNVFNRIQSKPIPNKRTYFRIQRYEDDRHRYFDYK